MSELICVMGESGTGKSTSVRTLDPKETAIVNCIGKPLPIKGWKSDYTKFTKEGGNYFASDKSDHIIQFLKAVSEKRPDIKNIVIDDLVYVMTNEFMRRSAETGFAKYTELAKNLWNVFNASKELRDDIKVFVLTHSDSVPGEFGEKPTIKMKSVGKLVDNVINPMGLFTILLSTDVKKLENGTMEYRFVTNNDGTYPAKSPMGMFSELYIPNDLGAVSKAIDEYYK